jgi:hypothetical protein
MIKDIYDITLDLAARIRNASEIKISEEMTAAMLFAEIQVNLEVLNAAKKILKKQESSWQDAIMLLSTEALELALFQKNGEKIISKYFKECEISEKDGMKEMTGEAAAFFIYRKISALKNIAIILQKLPGLSKAYKPMIRIENIEAQMLAINKQLRKELKSYINKKP